jgi:hypothetical protein
MESDTRGPRLPLGERLLHAAPDWATSALFLWAWLMPEAWHKTLVADLMLAMLVEFILIHSAPFLGSIVLADAQPARQRLRAFAGMTLFYLLFIGAFAWSFQSWWPFLAFAWLLAGKLAVLLGRRRDSARERLRQQGYWGASVAFYLVAVMLTLFLPIPELGIDRHGSYYGIAGSGAWVSDPHIVVAAGWLYFTLLALIKSLERASWWRPREQGAVDEPA